MAAGDVIKEYWRQRYKGQIPLELYDEWKALYGDFEKFHGATYQSMLAMEAAKLAYAWRAERLAESAYNISKTNEKLFREIQAEIKNLSARQDLWRKFARIWLTAIAAILGFFALGGVAWIFLF